MTEKKKGGISRRDFIKGTGLAVGGAAISSTVLGVACGTAKTEPTPTPGSNVTVPGPTVTVTKEVPAKLPKFKINGATIERQVKGHWTLVEFLRNELGLTGTKISCDEGVCGFCTVMIDGKAALACMVLAIEVADREITTVEGLAPDGKKLHPVQQAFIDEKGFQCGVCTPGQVMGAAAFLKLNPNPSLDDVRYGMSGNQCACGTYNMIQRSVLAAAAKMKGG